MKISRRSVLHISGLAAAALALTGCSAAGSAALGGKLPGLLKGLAKKGETAASSEAASDMAVTPPPEGEPLVPALPEYDADILTGAERSTNSRPVAVMVNNIANSQRQNARPQRGIGSADLLIEAKVEGGIYAAPSVTNLLKENSDPAVLLKTVLSDFDMEILSVDPIEYRCYCSRDRVTRTLISLGRTELQSIVDDGKDIHIDCQFCDHIYDYTPEQVADRKIKREKTGDMSLHLKPTRDIAAHLGEMKKQHPGKVLVGFALETNNEQQNAEGKLERKNFDFIVLNSLNDKGAGFRCDTNKISIIDRSGKKDYPLKSKAEVAADIIDHLVEVMNS